MSALLDELNRRGLLRAPEARRGERRVEERLVALCHEGLLVGGLSVARDVLPDELFGPLITLMGPPLSGARLTEVRGRAPVELSVSLLGDTALVVADSSEELVSRLNELAHARGGERLVAVLGEWQDMVQLWCVSRRNLAPLLARGLLPARNAAQISKQLSSKSG